MANTSLSISKSTKKIAQNNPNFYESSINVHKSCIKAFPNQILKYKHAILLHKTYNSYCPKMDWIEMNFYQTFTSCQTHFNTIKANNFNVGNNLLASRLSVLNLMIPLNDLNLSLDTFKVKYKSILLKHSD